MIEENDNEGFTYQSSSTVDECSTAGDVIKKLAGHEVPANQLYRGERKFLVQLTLKLTPCGGQTVTIPVFTDTVRGTMVRELIELAMEDQRTDRIIRSVLDNPSDLVLSDEVEETDKQGKLF